MMMDVATHRIKVRIRALKNGLSRYIERVRTGDEVIVTDCGCPVARLAALDATQDRFSDLVAAGIVRAPTNPIRHLPTKRINARAPISDLLSEQRR